MEVNNSFKNELTAKQCYNERYADGYMEYADPVKVAKIRIVLKNIKLPKNGTVLDFGCGSGALTAILQEELPDWTVYGTDLSPMALEKAKQRMPGGIFESFEECKLRENFFDLIFTHHVLEHVQDIDMIFDDFSHLAKKQSWFLHICPCGNHGSFEHSLCLLREDGIAPPNNRFFFEDPAHLRRLSTKDILMLGQKIGFRIIDEYYSNQYYGALHWISSSHISFWIEIFNPIKVKGLTNKIKMFLFMSIIMPVLKISNMINYIFTLPNPGLKRRIARLLFLPILPIANYFSTLRKANQEWETSSKKQNGSEMCIVFKRGE